MVGISSRIEYPTVGFLSVVSLSWYYVLQFEEIFDFFQGPVSFDGSDRKGISVFKQNQGTNSHFSLNTVD